MTSNIGQTIERYANGNIRRQYTELDDEYQGAYIEWRDNGFMWEYTFYKDDKFHGETKLWNPHHELIEHEYWVNDCLLFDFLRQPELYPKTEEQRLAFVLSHGAPLIQINE